MATSRYLLRPLHYTVAHHLPPQVMHNRPSEAHRVRTHLPLQLSHPKHSSLDCHRQYRCRFGTLALLLEPRDEVGHSTKGSAFKVVWKRELYRGRDIQRAGLGWVSLACRFGRGILRIIRVSVLTQTRLPYDNTRPNRIDSPRSPHRPPATCTAAHGPQELSLAPRRGESPAAQFPAFIEAVIDGSPTQQCARGGIARRRWASLF